ncbi:MAG: pyrroline-5-carboxylate reductase [Verrucomicrobiae bacterium]|nr:pyrroline-5-carboxylate reductase [Verrucomicrobiae bacterium]
MANLGLKIGFLGAGRMSAALARGVLDAGLCEPSQILASDPDAAQRAAFQKETGGTPFARNAEVASACDLAVLAVKPSHAYEVLDEIRKPFGARLLLSVAAGVSLARIEAGLDENARVVRAMPNTPALIRRGASAYSAGRNATEADLALVEALLGAVGLAVCLPEKMLDAVTGLSGSGPAYLFLAIEALSDGGVEMGLPRDVALKLAAQTVLGAAEMVLATGKHPGVLKDMVVSPGGTTIEGLRALEQAGVRAAFMGAVRAAAEKSRRLGQGR